MDLIARQPGSPPTPLDDLRHTPLGQIPLDRARAVVRGTERRADQPARVDVAAFSSSI